MRNNAGVWLKILVPLTFYRLLRLSLNCNNYCSNSLIQINRRVMKYTCILLLLFHFFSEENVKSQEYLPPPKLFMVTVDIESQLDSIIWYGIALQPNDYYIVAESYRPMIQGPPTLPVSAAIKETFYVNNNDNSVNLGHSVGYTVWGVHPLGDGSIQVGKFNHPDSTIFLQKPIFDSCSATISLSWNDYNNWRGSTSGFTVFRRTAPYVYIPIDNVTPDPNITQYKYVLPNILPNQTYDLYIEAANTDGIRRSNSNRDSVFTR